MGLSDNVAVVALVVSLLAPGVAIGQALQQILSTAEGYRRCASSVIGPWARLRYRKPNYRELRSEVRYSTPHLTTMSWREEGMPPSSRKEMTDELPFTNTSGSGRAAYNMEQSQGPFRTRREEQLYHVVRDTIEDHSRKRVAYKAPGRADIDDLERQLGPDEILVLADK